MKPRYSGKRSTKFWKRINRLKGLDWDYLYTMGCNLQDMEGRLIRLLEEAEARKKKGSP